jgi:general secretion pathway protein D
MQARLDSGKTMKRKHLRYLLTLLAVALLSAAALTAKNKKGDQFLKEGQAAQNKGDWDAALELYRQAVDMSPNDTSFVIAMRRAAFEAGQKHVEQGQKLRTEGKVAEAYQEFQRAILADPSSAIAIQELKRTQPLLNQKGPVKPEEAGLTSAERARRVEDQRIESMEGPPVLQPTTRILPQIKINNQPPSLLYRSVAFPAGIRVVFDSAYNAPSGRGFDVDLPPSSVEQAFDYLAILTHTAWKPISPNTIFVYEDNVTKRRDYDDLVTQVFYCTNVTSVQEFQEIANAVRTLGEVRRAVALNASRAIMVRDTVDKVALVGKLIHDLDKPKAEVIVDVIVMEANSSRTRNLGAAIANLAAAGQPISFTPRSSIAVGGSPGANGAAGTPGSSVTLNNLSHIASADFTTSLPGALVQALLTDNRTKVLNSPQVRVSDGMKVELQIGDKIPYASGSFQPGVGTVGVNPLVQTQFQFAETGVTVVIQPQVHASSEEVTLHVELNVSAVKQYVNLGGVSQPVIGQRKNTTDIRLRDGEPSLLGGLSQAQDSNAASGIPGMVDMPVLKYFFGSQTKETDRQELMIVLIPHIVRTPDYTPENLRSIFVGNESIVSIHYAPPAADQTPAEGAPGATAAPGAAAPAAVSLLVPAPAVPAPVPAPAAAPPGGQARLSFLPGVVQVSQNTPFTLTVQADNVTDALSLTPLQIKWDPAQLRLNDASAGDLLTRDGARLTTVKDIRNDTGDATLTLTRLADSGVSGSGPLTTLSFTALGKGSGTVTITGASIKNSQSQPVPVALSSVAVTVQ